MTLLLGNQWGWILDRARGSVEKEKETQGLFSFLLKIEVLSKNYGELACVEELSTGGNGCEVLLVYILTDVQLNGCASLRVCNLMGVQPCLERIPP